MAKNKQSNLIANFKILNVGVINKYTTKLGIGGGYSELVNYKSFLGAQPPRPENSPPLIANFRQRAYLGRNMSFNLTHLL